MSSTGVVSMNIEFDPIEEVLEELRQGKAVIVTDDANRENEGDLILAAEKATPELINFMIKHTSGVICVPMEGEDLDRLDLPLMTVRNTESMRTAYTISADARVGVSTGISAADRSRTIRLLADRATVAGDLVSRAMFSHSGIEKAAFFVEPVTRRQQSTWPEWLGSVPRVFWLKSSMMTARCQDYPT